MQKLDLIEYKNNATTTSLTSQMQEYGMVQNFTRDLLLQRVSEANDKGLSYSLTLYIYISKRSVVMMTICPRNAYIGT